MHHAHVDWAMPLAIRYLEDHEQMGVTSAFRHRAMRLAFCAYAVEHGPYSKKHFDTDSVPVLTRVVRYVESDRQSRLKIGQRRTPRSAIFPAE